VLAHDVSVQPASLPDHAVQQGKWPYLRAEAGQSAPGLLLLDLSESDYARLDDYEDVAAGLYVRETMHAMLPDNSKTACFVYRPVLEHWPEDWR
jgi:hypothetical protein